MRRFLIVIVAALAAWGLVTSTAAASSVHLKGGKNAEPSFTDLGLALRATGALSGLGNENILIILDAEANVFSSCINPGNGEHRPPGQNPAPVSVKGTQPISKDEIKNGTVSFSVTTSAPAPVVAGAPDCPNKSWTQTIDDLAFTSAKITVQQPVGTTVLTVNCMFNPPTSDGAVPSATVSCSQS